jgi:hypothetical protein
MAQHAWQVKEECMRDYELRRRMALEESLMQQYMPGFGFYDRTGRTYVTGWFRTNGGGQYQAKLQLSPSFPYEQPDRYIISPHTLWMHGNRGTINALGTSGAFHVLDNGPDGPVRICHTLNWDASITCVKLLVKCALWLEAYEAHLRNGDDLDHYLRHA